MQVEIRDLEQRVRQLERQNRNLKRAGIAAGAVLGFVALTSMASTMCRTVWAERFVLQDSGGRDRAVMSAYESGGVPSFSLLDEKGSKALTLGVADDGRAYVEIPGTEKSVRSFFAVSAEGNATIAKGKEVAAAR